MEKERRRVLFQLKSFIFSNENAASTIIGKHQILVDKYYYFLNILERILNE